MHQKHMASTTMHTPIMIATIPHIGMPISWATLSTISMVFSLIFSASLSVGSGALVVEPSKSAANGAKRLVVHVLDSFGFS